MRCLELTAAGADDLDIPPLFQGATERLASAAAQRRGGASIAQAETPAKRIDSTPTLSSARGQQAQAIAEQIRLQPASRAELAEIMGWHPGQLASAVKLALHHGLIEERDGRLHTKGDGPCAA